MTNLTIDMIDDTDDTGLCPCGCGEASFPYVVKGYEGYFDAAPGCAMSIAQDFVQDATPSEDE